MYLKYGKYVIITNCGVRELGGGMVMKKVNFGIIIAILCIVLAMIIEISIMTTARRKVHIKSETVKIESSSELVMEIMGEWYKFIKN